MEDFRGFRQNLLILYLFDTKSLSVFDMPELDGFRDIDI